MCVIFAIETFWRSCLFFFIKHCRSGFSFCLFPLAVFHFVRFCIFFTSKAYLADMDIYKFFFCLGFFFFFSYFPFCHVCSGLDVLVRCCLLLTALGLFYFPITIIVLRLFVWIDLEYSLHCLFPYIL